MRQSLPVAFTLVALSMGATALAAPIDNAALDEASKVFMAQRQTCGDKIVAAMDVTPQSGGFAPSLDPKAGKPHTIYNEAVGVERRPSGQGSKLNEADRLNGLQWKGRVQMVAKAAREVTVPRGGPAGAWGQWQPNVILATIDVEQRNGVWETKMQSGNVAAYGRYAQMRRPSCSELPS